MKRLLRDDDGISLVASPDGVLTLTLDRGENIFNPSLISSLSDAVALVEERDHPKALVITGKGKFFSNGLDLESLRTDPASLVESVWRLLSRILVMDCRTVASINGHAYGAGLFLALSCDYRIMRTERGYLNFPELNLGMRLEKGFAELVKAKISGATLREAILSGKRYSSGDAVKAGLVDSECPVERLSTEAEALAVEGLPERLGLANFNPTSLREMKVELYADAYRALSMGTVGSAPESRI